MKRAKPVDPCLVLEMAHNLVKLGIDFVPIPVIDQDDKSELAVDLQRRLKQIEKETSNGK